MMYRSKYEPLQVFLLNSSSNAGDLTLTFRRLEEIIGASLPKSAFQYREWWSNQSDVSNRPQAKAWISAGYEVDAVRLDSIDGWVRYRQIVQVTDK